MSTYTAGQAASLSGIDYRNLDYYATSGVVVPSIAVAEGKGSQRLYSFGDVVALTVIKRARGLGLTIRSLTGLIEYLRGHDYRAIGQPTYLLWQRDEEPKEAYTLDALASWVAEDSEKGYPVAVFNLSALVDDLIAKGA